MLYRRDDRIVDLNDITPALLRMGNDFQRILNRLDGIENRLIGMENRLTTFETRVTGKFDQLDETLSGVDASLHNGFSRDKFIPKTVPGSGAELARSLSRTSWTRSQTAALYEIPAEVGDIPAFTSQKEIYTEIEINKFIAFYNNSSGITIHDDLDGRHRKLKIFLSGF